MTWSVAAQGGGLAIQIKYNKPCAIRAAVDFRWVDRSHCTLNPNRGLYGQCTASNRPRMAASGKSPNRRLS